MRFASIVSALLLTFALSVGASALEITAASVANLATAAKTLKPGESKKVKTVIDGAEIEVELIANATGGFLVTSSKLNANFTFDALADGTLAITIQVLGSSTSTVLALSADGKTLTKADSLQALAALHGGKANGGTTNPPAGQSEEGKGGSDLTGTITLTGGPSDAADQANKQNNGQTTHQINTGEASTHRL